MLINEYCKSQLEVRIICATCALCFSLDVHVVCLFWNPFHQGIYCSFQVVKGPTRGLQDDSDVAESDACSEVGSEEDDGVEERLELILDPLSCQETSENEWEFFCMFLYCSQLSCNILLKRCAL